MSISGIILKLNGIVQPIYPWPFAKFYSLQDFTEWFAGCFYCFYMNILGSRLCWNNDPHFWKKQYSSLPLNVHFSVNLCHQHVIFFSSVQLVEPLKPRCHSLAQSSIELLKSVVVNICNFSCDKKKMGLLES